MSEVIKISLIMSGEDNSYEYHRVLPSTYFDGKLDLFSDEIENLRIEARSELGDLGNYEEYIRIAAFDKETGRLLSGEN